MEDSSHSEAEWTEDSSHSEAKWTEDSSHSEAEWTEGSGYVARVDRRPVNVVVVLTKKY